MVTWPIIRWTSKRMTFFSLPCETMQVSVFLWLVGCESQSPVLFIADATGQCVFFVVSTVFWLKLKLVTIWHFILSFAGHLQWKLHLLHTPRHCEHHSSPLDFIWWLQKYLYSTQLNFLHAPWLLAETSFEYIRLGPYLIRLVPPMYHPWILLLSKTSAHAGLVLFGRAVSI